MADWPFGNDADRDDPLTTLRIAVTSSHPQHSYLVSFDRGSAERPTEREAAMLASYLKEYKAYWYTEWYLAELVKLPLDVDGGAAGVTFHKYGPDDWAYRRNTWTVGPMFVPEPPHIRQEEDGGSTLEQVMDRAHNLGEDGPAKRWVDWKARHPEVFGTDIEK